MPQASPLRSKLGDLNVNSAIRSTSAIDIAETAYREVLAAGTAVVYAQQTEAPFLVLSADKAFYVCPANETASSTNGLLVPADTIVRLAANVQQVGKSGVTSTGPTLTMNASTKDKMDATAFTYVVEGIPVSKSAAEDLEFSAANTINTGGAASALWGAWLFQVNASGTISTKPAGGLTDQVYATEQEALDALPDVDSGNIAIAYLTLQVKASQTWTCNTTEFDSGTVVNDYTFTAISAPTAAQRGVGGHSWVTARYSGVGGPYAGRVSRIGAGWSFDAPASNTKVYIAECW
jgi:hypothetical protein